MDSWIQTFRRAAYRWLLRDFPAGEFPEVAVLPLGNPDLFDLSPLLSRLTDVRRVGTFHFGNYGDKPVAVSSSKLGAPAAALAMDVMGMTPVSRVFAIGYCGGLQDAVNFGDLVIPTQAVGDEGTSQHYRQLDRSLADEGMVEALVRVCRNRGHRHHLGCLWSTDGILRETDEHIADWSDRGLIGVDMETSALFTVAAVTGKRAAAVLVASDNPLLKKCADGPTVRRGYLRAVEVLFDCL
ncbi:MAG: phosphorylase family protein [Chloroflexota bacterium]